jgi:uncharacterized protein involved in exopolysaccharide biosynthesis
MHIGLRGTAVALTCAILAACGGGDGGSEGQRIAALSGRLDAIEKRLAKSDQTADAVEQLRNDAASLDRRLTSLETSLRELGGKIAAGGAPPATPPAAAAPVKPNAGRPPSGGHAAWGDEPTTRPDRSTRRAELRALSDEFRQKLADLRTQPGAMDPGSDRTREVLDWYRDQRRAILKGEGRTDQPAQ